MKIIEAKNIGSKLRGNLFVRYYLPSGLNNKAPITLNTREIPVKYDPVWNESLSLECHGMDINKLTRQDKLVFELRLRNVVPLIGATFGGSKLLGWAEVPLEEVLNSPNAVIDKWLTLVSTRGNGKEDVAKSCKIKVEIKVGVLDEKITSREVRNVRRNWDMCGCRDGHHDQYGCTSDDYDVFALVAALEAL